MDHDELRDLVAIYAIGALPTDEAQELETHLRGCVECCWEALTFSRATVAAMRQRWTA